MTSNTRYSSYKTDSHFVAVLQTVTGTVHFSELTYMNYSYEHAQNCELPLFS